MKKHPLLAITFAAGALASAAVSSAQSNYEPYSFETLAGLAGSLGSADGTGSAARFYYPYGVATDSAGNVYVADQYNYTIRKVTPGGVVSTLAGLVGSFGSADGTGTAARFSLPAGVATDSAGNVYVADQLNHTIRKVTPSGVVTTLAGRARRAGSADGTGSAARFYYPSGVATDSAGNVYVGDEYNQTIRKVTPGGVVTTLAGLAGNVGSADGTGSAASFNRPSGVATDSAGNVYVADSGNNTIRKATPGGVVTTLAGLAGSIGSADGTGRAARFYQPSGVATDSAGNVYVADFRNYTIRKVTPSGVVTTLAGLTNSLGSADGTGSAARFNFPRGVATDSAGKVYVADYGNYTIRAGIEREHFETETLTVQALSGATQSVLSDVNLSGAAGTQLNATAAGQYITYSIPVAGAGTYKVRVGVKTGIKRGIFQVSIGSNQLGLPQDEYSPAIGYSVRDLGTATFTSGGNKPFKFLVTGKNASSGGYSLVFDYIELEPTNRREAEALTVQAISPVPAGFTGTWYGVFNNVLASAGSAVAFNATAIGNFVTYTVPVAKVGTYHVLVGIQTKASKGIFQLAINGVNQGSPQDEYSPSVTYGMRDLGTATLSSGSQAFKFYVTGKNPSSSNYNLVFDYIELVP